MNICTYAESFLLIPYVWGGAHPADGLDCSGFLQEILAYADLDPVGDQSAQALFKSLVKDGSVMSPNPQTGAIVFYGQSVNSITHVAFMLSKDKIIEAAGGGSKNVDRATALKIGGFIRIRPMTRRKDVVAIIMPKYPEWVIKELDGAIK